MKRKIPNLPKPREDVMMMLISIVLAILLWSYVMSVVDPMTKRTFSGIPVRIQGIDDLRQRNLTLMGERTETVSVVLEGKRSAMDSVRKENIQATVNLQGLEKGEHNLGINIHNFNNNVRLVSQEPLTLVMSLDENQSRRVKVTMRTRGELAEGYLLGPMNLSSSHVTISGPKSIVEKVQKVTATVDLRERKQTTALSTNLTPRDQHGNKVQGVTIEPSRIDVEVPIYKTTTVPVILNVTGTAPEGYEAKDLVLRPNTLTLRGNSALINKTTEIKTQPISWESILANGTTTVDPIIPEGLAPVGAPEVMSVSYEGRGAGTRQLTLTRPHIEIKNLGEGLTAEIADAPEEIVLTLRGNEERLSAIKPENLNLSIDVSGVGEGTHTLNLRTNTLGGIEVVDIAPLRVHCTITPIQ